MNIQTALIYAQYGYKIRREGWKSITDDRIIDDVFVSDGLLMQGDRVVILPVSDLIEEDWVIVR